MEYSENGNPPYARLARIESIALRDVNGNVMVKFRMLYRPEETVAGRKTFHGKKELFLTDHYHTQRPEDYYFCLEYEHETGWFSPDIIEVYVFASFSLVVDDRLNHFFCFRLMFHDSLMKVLQMPGAV
ncbi:bromo adjacent homology domain, zinc finger, RING/FYVE/PHD-type containing protein [Tanacetum coccineum]